MTIDDKNNLNLLKSVDDFNYIQLNNINKKYNDCIIKNTCQRTSTTSFNTCANPVDTGYYNCTNEVSNEINMLNTNIQTQYYKIPKNGITERVANYKNDQSQKIQWFYSYLFYFYYLIYFIFVGFIIFKSFFKEKTGFQGIKKYGLSILGYLVFPFLIGFIEELIIWVLSFLYSGIVSNVFLKNIY